MNIRSLQPNDYYLNYISLLNQLSIIDNTKISYNKFENFIQNLAKNHIIKVININNKIIATGTLYIEQKIIHYFGQVGHIEDIVISRKYRKRGLGKAIVQHLMKLSEAFGCYKCILNCGRDKVGFYIKNSFKETGVEMAIYHE